MAGALTCYKTFSKLILSKLHVSETGSVHYMGKSKARMQDNCSNLLAMQGLPVDLRSVGYGNYTVHSTRCFIAD